MISKKHTPSEETFRLKMMNMCMASKRHSFTFQSILLKYLNSKRRLFVNIF